MPSRKPKDVVLVHGRTPDGQGYGVIRARQERLEVGLMRPLEQGKPIHGEVVKLTPRPEMPLLFDAETEYAAPGAESDKAAESAPEPAASQGPPMVATDAYRKNWDAIWSRPRRDKLAN
ncbi:MAG TPA: hypothetical protein VHE30_06750 [Polyangiaceae bacterium]|nr:hypothetical protein [Polyangiaceae bacterium]